MIPVRLKLSNFTSYGENPPELDFTKFKLAAISGLNGAGKSSLLDAITWCVWGQSRAGDSSDALIHSGASNMFVEFEFELDGHNFTIKRLRSKKGGGQSSLEFWSGSTSSPQVHNLTEGTIKATQEKIIQALHLTFDTFTNSSYLRQGHADEFTTKGPTDRKRILTEILGLDHYDILEEKAKEKIKQIQTDLTLLEYQLLDIEAELSRKDESKEKKILAEKKISDVENDASKIEKELKDAQEAKASLIAASEQQNKLKQTLLSLQSELDDILTQGKSRAERIKKLEEELADLPIFDEKLKELKVLEKEREEYLKALQKKLELENQLTIVKSSVALKGQEKRNLEKKIIELKSHIKDLEKEFAKCPTCGQEIGKDKKQIVTSDLRLKIKDLNAEGDNIKTTAEDTQILKLQKEIDAIRLDDKNYKETLQKLGELQSLQERKEKLIAAQATLESEKQVVLDLRLLFKNKKTQIEKLDMEVKKLPDLADNLNNLIISVNKKAAELGSLRLEEKEARNLLGQAAALISRVEQLEKVAVQKKDEKNRLHKEKQIYEELAHAFGKKGIQAMIIEAAIPEIEQEANQLLGRLTEDRMKVSLQTQRETKTKLESGEKGIVETLDIIISDEMGERIYENFSGGEQFRVNFSIRLAISKLLTRRAGSKLQFLIIDEGFGTQDAPGRARLVEVIDVIKDDFEKILVITHIEELKDEFPVRIEVSKNSEGSIFEMKGA